MRLIFLRVKYSTKTYVSVLLDNNNIYLYLSLIEYNYDPILSKRECRLYYYINIYVSQFVINSSYLN